MTPNWNYFASSPFTSYHRDLENFSCNSKVTARLLDMLSALTFASCNFFHALQLTATPLPTPLTSLRDALQLTASVREDAGFSSCNRPPPSLLHHSPLQPWWCWCPSLALFCPSPLASWILLGHGGLCHSCLSHDLQICQRWGEHSSWSPPVYIPLTPFPPSGLPLKLAFDYHITTTIHWITTLTVKPPCFSNNISRLHCHQPYHLTTSWIPSTTRLNSVLIATDQSQILTPPLTTNTSSPCPQHDHTLS